MKKPNLVKPHCYDAFIIWSNGIQYHEEIIKYISEQNFLEIILIKKYFPPKIDKFVKQIYSTDTVPLHHLRAKTKYLLHSPPEIILIVVHSLLPRKKFYGEGQFRQIQCEYIKDIKETLRNRFNPRTSNGKRTEEHIIHGTDNEKQTNFLIKLIINKDGIEHITKRTNNLLPVPWHIKHPNHFKIKQIPINQIFCSILEKTNNNISKKITPIEQTPHYLYLLGNPIPYQDYLKTFKFSLLTSNHSSLSFDKLIKNLNYPGNKTQNLSFILLRNIDPQKYVILDGVHRAACLYFQRAKTIKSAVIYT